MLNFNLISLILNHFLNGKNNGILVYQCWNKETLNHFSRLSSHHSVYSQYVDLNDSAALLNFGFRYMRYDRPQIGVFMDMNCNQSKLLIDESSRQRFFNYRYNWLIYDGLSNFSRFYGIFLNVNLSVDTRLTYVVPQHSSQDSKSFETNKTSFITFDVYNNGRMLGGALNITTNYEIECRKTTGCQNRKFLSNLYKRSLYGNRESLRDVTMRIALVVTRYNTNVPVEDIITILSTEKDFNIDTICKFGMQMFMLIKDSLYINVNYTVHDRWTDSDAKGGAVGALVDERADLITTPFFHSAERLRYLTAIAQTGSSRSVCMFLTPPNSGIQGRVFLDPFSTKVWISFAVILLLSAVFLWLIFFVEFHQMKSFHEFSPSLLTTFLISFGSACAQGSFIVPRSFAGRLAFISVTLVCFLMYNYYTSIVVSSLLGSPVKSNMKTLGDLADSNLVVGIEPLPYTHTYLNFSTLPMVRHFVKRKVQNKKNVWYTNQEGINKMRSKPGFVYIFEAASGYIIIENQFDSYEICNLNEIPFRVDSLIGQHLHKNSSYKEILRLKLMRILESGIHSKHHRLWLRTRLNCLPSNVVLSVGMEYAAPLFLLLLLAYLFVLMILALEIISFRLAKRVQERAAAHK